MPTRIGSKAKKQCNRNIDRDEPKLKEKANAHSNYDNWFDDYGDSSFMDEDYDAGIDEYDYHYKEAKNKSRNKSDAGPKRHQNQSPSISSDDNVVFDRCQIPIEFTDDSQQKKQLAPFSCFYAPVLRAQFNLNHKRPENHTNVKQYDICVQRTLDSPYYIAPEINSKFPKPSQNSVFIQRNVSVLPILIAAHRNHIDIFQYDVVSERNSLRKIAMNNQDYVIGVERFGQTLFFRRFDNRITNLNDQGHLFEKLCTGHYDHNKSFHHLIEGHIGVFKTLISAEIDAIDQVTGQAIELKSRMNANDISNRRDCWLQAFLGGVPQVIVGTCTNPNSLKLVGLHTENVTELVRNEIKDNLLWFLNQVFRFLQANVAENTTYLLSRRYDQRHGRHGLHLYRVANKDRHELSFISRKMLDEIRSF